MDEIGTNNDVCVWTKLSSFLSHWLLFSPFFHIERWIKKAWNKSNERQFDEYFQMADFIEPFILIRFSSVPTTPDDTQKPSSYVNRPSPSAMIFSQRKSRLWKQKKYE